MTPGQSYHLLLDRFARVVAWLIFAVSCAAIFGWTRDIAYLKSVVPGFATMKPNTAFGFLASSIAIWFLTVSVPGSQSTRIARCLSAFVIVVGALSLTEHLFRLDLGIDQLLFADDPAAGASHPGLMAPATAANFLFFGLALLSLKANQSRFATWAHWLVIPPLFVSALAIVGYTYGVNSLYQVGPYNSMALHTAISFFVLALAVIAADSEHGFARLASSDTAGGLVARQLLPTLPFMIFFIGWTCLEGELAGYYDFTFGLALMVLLSITVCVAAVASTTAKLHKIDTTRQAVEAEIMALNAGLERRVEERTQQLAQLSAELSAANAALEQLSLEDGLTHLANRRAFDAYLANQIEIARRHNRVLSLILCDADEFKAFNDHYGHQAGDRCLRRLATALRSCCKRPGDMVARYGGEEFAMILLDTDLAGATHIAEAAMAAVARLKIPHALSPTTGYVSISGGIADLVAPNRITAQQLIEAADKNLFQAKRMGRNRMVSSQTQAA